MKNNRLIITGASGFVGRNLCSHFGENGDIEIIPLNLRDTFNGDLLSDATSFIHLAGKAHDLSRTANDDEYFEVNTEMTKKLFDWFLYSRVRDFIYFSSVKAVADTLEGVLTENVEGSPKTPYGKSKLLAEEYLLSKQLPAHKRLFIIRPCMIHGPGNKGNLNLLYKIVKKGIPYPLGAFENKRSFLSIENLNFVVERLISGNSIPGGIYNLADDIAISTNDLIRIISSALGRSPKIWKLNTSFICSLAIMGDKLHLPLNSERLKKLTESYIVDNAKIKQVLNIRQFPVSSTDGLLKTIQSFG